MEILKSWMKQGPLDVHAQFLITKRFQSAFTRHHRPHEELRTGAVQQKRLQAFVTSKALSHDEVKVSLFVLTHDKVQIYTD